MTADDRDDEGAVHKVDTVPPPDGEGDAYSAETKVGPASSDAWAELIRKANEEGERNAASAPASRPFAKPSSGPASSGPKSGNAAPPSGVSPKAPPADAPLPRVYQDEDDEKYEEATVLSHAAKPELPATPIAPSARREPPSVPRPTPAAAPAVPPSLTATTPSALGVPPALATLNAPNPVSSPAVTVSTPASPIATTAVSSSIAPAPTSGSLPPSVPMSSGPLSTHPRPLAFLPGDPALPDPSLTARPSSSRALAVTIAVCLTIFAIGIVLYLSR